MERSTCRSDSSLTLLFFSPQDDDDNLRKEEGRSERIAKAKAICDQCPVREECLEWAYVIGDEHAILGSMTATERKHRWRRAVSYFEKLADDSDEDRELHSLMFPSSN